MSFLTTMELWPKVKKVEKDILEGKVYVILMLFGWAVFLFATILSPCLDAKINFATTAISLLLCIVLAGIAIKYSMTTKRLIALHEENQRILRKLKKK